MFKHFLEVLHEPLPLSLGQARGLALNCQNMRVLQQGRDGRKRPDIRCCTGSP